MFYVDGAIYLRVHDILLSFKDNIDRLLADVAQRGLPRFQQPLISTGKRRFNRNARLRKGNAFRSRLLKRGFHKAIIFASNRQAELRDCHRIDERKIERKFLNRLRGRFRTGI